jgi:hypothetical protein
MQWVTKNLLKGFIIKLKEKKLKSAGKVQFANMHCNIDYNNNLQWFFFFFLLVIFFILIPKYFCFLNLFP